MNRWYIEKLNGFCYNNDTIDLNIFCSKKIARECARSVDKSTLTCYNNYAVGLPLTLRCSSEEVVIMGCKKKLNKRKTGEKIYRAIERSGLTYDKVAEELGLSSPRVIYEWTNGNKLPSLVRLVNLAILLNVQIEGLLEIE